MLHSSVTRLGGLQQVDQWRQCTDMAAAAAANGRAALAAAAHALRQAYASYLWEYEQVYYFRCWRHPTRQQGHCGGGQQV
jgi:hypothetical protein